MQGTGDREVVAEGNAVLRHGQTTITADWMRFDNETSDIEARGNVRIEQVGNAMMTPSLRFRTSDSTGEAQTPDFILAPRQKQGMAPVGGRGHADRLVILGENRFEMVNATFTTCRPEDDDWYLKVDQLNIDYGRDLGVAKWATLVFQGVPILKTPYLDFSLNERRKSGVLPPTIGTTGKNGPEIAVPYYFNLAPNYDATVTPRYMAKRGLQIGSEVRYLDRFSTAVMRAEYLPEDQIRGSSRSAVSFSDVFARGPVAGLVNLNKVSDNDYFRDLSSRVASVSQVYLPREGLVTYTGNWWDGGIWSSTARMQSFQTLQDPNRPVVTPYNRLPQILLNASKPDVHGADFAFAGETVDFHHPTLVTGLRTIANPSLAFPIVTPSAFVTPKVGFHSTVYNLSNPVTGTPDSIQRTLPIFSTDSGMVFERDTTVFGDRYLQTLEPRAYYLYVPYKNQDRIPLFDTAVADLNYAQLFSENSFVGGDRINDANQVTLAMTSRLLSPRSGQELIRGTIGQRYYLSDQRVTLNPTDPRRTYQASDWLASLAGRIAPKWTVETAIQYNQRSETAERFTVSARYQPEVHKVLNMSYRYFRDQFNQVDVSSQWPLGGPWYGVGRYNYSLLDHRVVESLAGFEYNADCWIGRVVVQHFAAATGVATNAVFLQLELTGFSRIGSNPLEALRRNIPGYTRINQLQSPSRAFELEN